MRNLLKAITAPSRHPRRDLRFWDGTLAAWGYILAIASYGDWLELGLCFTFAVFWTFCARAENEQLKRERAASIASPGLDADLLIGSLEAARRYARAANDPVVANRLDLLQGEIESALKAAKRNS